ncbi:non-ribosomal peptide synthetase [Methylocapsa palsarum]|uniref:Non-ribosomal peptide synthase domain TIGR01720/amino acid adenylation domain-containing protein n=1 Tax=Methylocapsa palsarum TaxID=1612308 RepID=A0A1I4AP40_9HYPH|nr:non-ribosomal peptide synthetase [Methylocapsa palsarum]SFK58268.1 non-ribosomal peptide synthase domain TIGR01720/amino acid adenylation domain-containing protein [Methylocapsa palsarum]
MNRMKPGHPAQELSATKRLLLERRLRGDRVASPVAEAIAPRPPGPAPLSFAQQRLWFLDQFAPMGAAYNIPAGLWLKGALDVAALEQALNEVIRRHEALRTTFPAPDGQPVQAIAQQQPLTLVVEDLAEAPEAARAAANELARQEAIRSFDLSTGPLIRVRLIRVAAEATPGAPLSIGSFDHLLVIVMHHIIADAWSIDILIRELSALYQAFAAGTPCPLENLPLQYADYAHWQRARLANGRLDAQLAYWRQRLAGYSGVLEFPTDRARPPVPGERSGIFGWRLSEVLRRRLDALGRGEGATLFMTLLAAFYVLLWRHCGQTDLCVGSPIANRNELATEKLIGFFANTVALRTSVSGDPPFLELLRRVRDVVLEAQANQDAPFEWLVEALAPARDPGRTPIIQTMFVLQDSPQGALQLGSLDVAPLPLETFAAKFDLTLTVVRERDGLAAYIEHRADLFSSSTITRLSGHYSCLLEGLVVAPSARIGSLPLLSAPERAQILDDWSGASSPSSGADVPVGAPDLSLADLFTAQAARTPDALAVECDGEGLTYAQLNRRANRLAARLRRLGVGPEVIVGVLIERSLELIVAILGILKAGGAYLPLDPAAPRERRAFMIEESGAALVLASLAQDGHAQDGHAQDGLAQDGLAQDDLTEGGARLVRIDQEPAQDPDQDPADECDPPPRAGPDHLAYVIYTSGSTGRPKGVMVSHRNVTRLFATTRDAFGFGPDDVFTLFHSCAFDFSVWELWGALLHGGRLVVVPYWTSREPEAFYELLARTGTTVLNQTPSAFRQLLRTQAFAANRGLSLRLVIFGGEALDSAMLRPWFARHGAAHPRLVNMYGITETTVHVTLRDLDPGGNSGNGDHTASGIGRPLADLRVYLLDGGMQPVPEGVAGELYVGGAGLARGYLRRPGLTAERFIPDPFGAPGERLYKTGDLARWDAGGGLDYLGRIDHQVKIRGHRIEPGEIEAALREIEGVRQALVIVREDPLVREDLLIREDLLVQDDPSEAEPRGGKSLVAYVAVNAAAPEPQDNDPADQARLRAALERRLPGYMIPAAFVRVDEFPLTSSGKIDRDALPAPGVSGATSGYAPPQTPTEEILARIWSEVLGLEQVGTQDNFFALGGDSILSIQVASRARTSGLDVTPRLLFERQTIAALAVALAEQQDRAGEIARPEQGSVGGEAGLTPIQRWFFALEAENPHHWNQAILLTPQMALDADVLEQALHQTLAHHDALRLRFVRTSQGDGANRPISGAAKQEGGEGWRQYHAAGGDEPVLRRIDLRAVPAPAQAAEVTEAAAALQRTLHLGVGPLLRAALFDLGSSQRLFLVAHHLVIDGVSWRIFLEDIESACRQIAAAPGRPAILPAKTASFRNWAEHLAVLAQSLADENSPGGAEFADERAYWSAAARARVRALPADDALGSNAESLTGNVLGTLSAAQTEALLRLVPRAYRTSIEEILLTALVEALGSLSGESRVLIDLEGHGREELSEGIDLSRTVGWFTSLYPVLLSIRPGASPGEALKAVKEQLRAIPRKGIGYGLLRYCSPDGEIAARLRDGARAQVSFNYLGQYDQSVGPDALFAAAEEPVGPERDGRTLRPHDLAFFANVLSGRLEFGLSYSMARWRPERAQALLAAWSAAIARLIEHCLSPAAGGRTPSDFPLALLTQQQLDELPEKARAIEDAYPLTPLQQGLLFHALYEPGSGVYVEQMICTFRGELDVAAFRAAWRRAAARHPVLRTSFLWDGFESPLQVVHAKADAPFIELDQRGAPAAAQEELWRAQVAEDRRTGFDPGRAPLMRFLLVRRDEQTYDFLWTHHHLLLDGWSVALLLKDVLTDYAALSRGAAPQPAGARPFRDYVAFLAGRDLAAAKAYWRTALAGFTRPTPISAALSRPWNPAPEPPAPIHRTSARLLSHASTAALEECARRHRVTLNTLAQGAFALLLNRYTGEREILFGVTVSGRPAELRGVETMVGPFINTLPLRVEVPPQTPTGDWLRLLLAQNLEMRHYEYAPLALVQSWSDAPRDEALFDAILVFENFPADRNLAGKIGGVEIGGFEALEQTHYALTLTTVPGPQLELSASYDEARFTPGSVERLLDHFETLLEALAANPESRLCDLSLLRPAERELVLESWSGASSTFSEAKPLSGACVHEIFAAQARRNPNAAAITTFSETLSYRALNERANQLAHYLISLGVGPEVAVGLMVEPSPDMFIGLMAILKAGGAYLPLDPDYPQDRLRFMIEDARIKLLITVRSRPDSNLPAPSIDGLKVVRVDADATAFAGEPRSDPPRLSGPDHLAYIIYTSGSTGRPKGVMVEHGSLVNLAQAQASGFGLGPGDRVLQFSSISFDQAAEEIFPAWISGASVVLPPARSRDALLDFLRFVAAAEVTVLPLTTAFWVELATALTDADLPAPARLRLVFVGGEKAPANVLRHWRAATGDAVAFVNTYGPTEATITATAYHAPGGARPLPDIPIGRPIANAKVYVLDSRLEPIPAGIAGELYIGGPGVSRGYLGRPGLTAERFIPDPFADPRLSAGLRLYRTGDLVRFRADGELEFLGRVDDQIKLRGYRIELGEIAARLREHPGVGDAAAVVRASGETRSLAAYVSGAGQPAPDAATLRHWLRERLPDFMIPGVFVALERLPRGASGKIDRAALPAPLTAIDATPGRPATRDAVDEILCAVFAEALGRERVGNDENFFEIGGHSLAALQAISRIRRDLGAEITLRAVFEAPTAAQLGRLIRRSRSGGRDAGPLPLARRDAPIPLSFAQQRLWFLDQLEPGSPFYNVPIVLRLSGRLNLAALERALQDLAHRHEALRTSFPIVDGRPVQAIAPAMTISLPIVRLLETDAGKRPTELRRLIRAAAQEPFDLSAGPLIRATAFESEPRDAEGAGGYVLLLTLHHAIADGWSTGVLASDLAEFYACAAAGRASTLRDLPLQYADYTMWQGALLDSGELDGQTAYWRTRLKEAPAVLRLPTDRPRPPVQTYAGAAHRLILPLDLTQRLRALSRRQGATLFMTLLAAFDVILSRYSGEDDICVGTPVANRPRVEFEGLIGCFTNTLVIRATLAGNPRFTDLLASVRAATLEAQDHQDLPFERLVAELNPARELGHNPLFQVMFGLQNTPAAPIAIEDLLIEPLESDAETAMFDLAVDAVEAPEGLWLTFEYNTDLFLGSAIERLAGHYVELLASIAARPEARIGDLAAPSTAEQRRLLEWGTGAATGSPAQNGQALANVVCWFETQADRCATRCAIVDGSRQATYGEINALANHLARRLIRFGAGPDVLVGIHARRSIELVIALLATLKSCAAFVPLDPALPDERLRSVLVDCAPKIVLSDAPSAGGVATFSGPVVDLASALQAEGPDSNPTAPIDADSLAYVLFTSGSTGRPKGVAISHRSLVNRIAWGAAEYGLGEDDVILQQAAPGFDVSVGEIVGCLTAGARLVIAGEAAGDPARLNELILAHAVTMIDFTPSLLRAVMAAPGWADCGSLRVVSCGGEAMKEELRREFFASRQLCRLYNNYGPTETTIDASSLACCALEHADAGAGVPIGRPIANTRLYVLDPFLNLVPEGVVGELCVGGHGLARGYFRQPALTAERFAPDPFAPGERIYRTGDLARWRVDGALEFHGRTDQQVKVRGLRIELEEIEARLEACPGVAEAAVSTESDPHGDLRLVAFIVTRDRPFTPAALRLHLLNFLPAYMTPSVWRFVERLPRDDNGKLRRTALPNLSPPVASRDAPDTEPADELEATLARLFAESLGLPKLGRRDGFFEFGGHSLMAVRLAQLISAQTQTEIPLVSLFQFPTVEALAGWMRSNRRAPAGPFVTLRRGEPDRPPLYVLPTGAGHVHNYHPLIAALDPRDPVHGLQFRAIENPAAEALDYSAIVTDYAAVLRENHRGGAYRLLGWSLGGLIALGVAARLEASGEKVAFLGLVDPIPPRNHDEDDWKARLSEFLEDPEEQARLAALPEDQLRLLEQHLAQAPIPHWPARAALWGHERGLWFAGAPIESLRLETSLWRHGAAIEDTFSEPALRASLNVWWATATLRGGDSPPQDWPVRFGADSESVIIDANHNSIISSPALHASVREILGRLST